MFYNTKTPFFTTQLLRISEKITIFVLGFGHLPLAPTLCNHLKHYTYENRNS